MTIASVYAPQRLLNSVLDGSMRLPLVDGYPIDLRIAILVDGYPNSLPTAIVEFLIVFLFLFLLDGFPNCWLI